MISFLSRHKKAFIIMLILICAITMFITASYRVRPDLVQNALSTVIVPAQRGVNSTRVWISNRFESIFNHSAVVEERNRLRREIDEAQTELSRLRMVDEDNRRLNELFELSLSYSMFETTGARIIAHDPGNWHGSFTVDKGSRDGIREGMPVISGGGLVGRVFEVGHNFSKVIRIIDDVGAVSVRGLISGDGGLLRGDTFVMQDGLARMEFISADSLLAIGEELVTSHSSTVFPPNIAVGVVVDIWLDGNNTRTALVRPHVDFVNLEYVLIVTDRDNEELLQ